MSIKHEPIVSRKDRLKEVALATAGAALTGGLTSAAFLAFTAGGYVADLKTLKVNQEQQAVAIEAIRVAESTHSAQLAATEAHYQEISSNLAQSRNETSAQLSQIRDSLNDLNRRLR
ncbi:hypothetical protein UFOVP83_6 [uncultured Caudovirales phage]|uniref:Uncharacterized protein n=1 Tax=uncultured Caudovirales phage TaxID=2100421 RepID=A0A6J5TCY3_9CAUD|nr:hypothetical protein UFOVP83_6 [uncultured Caudovirales phage]